MEIIKYPFTQTKGAALLCKVLIGADLTGWKVTVKVVFYYGYTVTLLLLNSWEAKKDAFLFLNARSTSFYYISGVFPV